jgi:hypothetical protein
VEKAILSASELDVSLAGLLFNRVGQEPRNKQDLHVDEELVGKVKGVNVENPIPRDIMREYHQICSGEDNVMKI